MKLVAAQLSHSKPLSFSRFLSVLCDLVVLRTQQPPSKFSAMSGRKPDCFYGGRGTSRVRAYEKHGRDRFLPRADSADFCFRPTLRTQRRSPTSGIRPTPGSTAQFAAGHNHRGGGCGFCCAQGFTRRGRQFWYPGPTGSDTASSPGAQRLQVGQACRCE